MGPVAPGEAYHCRPVDLVMDDLRHGEGKPPPTDTHFPEIMDGHGWVSEGVDLSRIAIAELLRREQLGELPAKYRLEIDQLALADLHNSIQTPGQFYLRQNLGDRWIAGALPVDEQNKLYLTAPDITFATDPVVTQWNDVPIRFRCRCGLPNSSTHRWAVQGRYKSVRIDENRFLIDDMLMIQSDRSREWHAEYGDYIEWLHAQHQLADDEWRQYGAHQLQFYIRNHGPDKIAEGDPLPFDFVQVARRGNSHVPYYTGAQWKTHFTFSDGVKGPINTDQLDLGIGSQEAEYVALDHAKFASATLGTHTMRGQITSYDLTWTDRPADLPMPTQYDLGEISFTVVPKTGSH
jgi:hypothetical protein